MRANRVLLVGLALGVVGSANAQIFMNGNFEGGNLGSWTITPTTNGTTTVQTAVQYDIDGAGTRPTNFAAKFSVGQVVFASGVPAGINLTQSLNLIGGLQYYFDFDWAVQRDVATGNAQGGIFSLTVNGAVIASQAAGPTTGTTPIYGHVTGIFTPTSSGAYTVGGRIERPFTPGASLHQYVDNFAVTAVPEPATMAVLALGGAFLARRRRKV
jgi:hypothetical protein